jgi:hypothetical protein
MNLSFKTHLKNTSIVLRTVMSAGVLYSCATYNVQKGKNLFEVKDSEIKSENDFKLSSLEMPEMQMNLRLSKL